MRDTWIDQTVQCVLIAVITGGIISVFDQLRRYGFESGDVFSLAGALIGAAATVAGAIWIADRQSRAAHRRETSLLVEACRPLLQKGDALHELYVPDRSISLDFKQGLHDLRARVREVSAVIEEALDRAQTLNFRERVKARKAHEGIESFVSFYDDVFGSQEELHPMDERSWQWALTRLREGVGEFLQELDRA